MTTAQPTETVEDLIRQLDDRCTELSEAESMIEALKAGATELRLELSIVLNCLVDGRLSGIETKLTEQAIRRALFSYSQRLGAWDKANSRP